MENTARLSSKKGFIYKTIFFISLLVVVSLVYLESKNIIDIFYFAFVFVMFVRYLIINIKN